MARFSPFGLVRKVFRAIIDLLPSGIMHSGAGTTWLRWTGYNFDSSAADTNSIVQACIRWVQRTFTEAPAMLEEWNPDRERWEHHTRDALLDLLERPNAYYGGSTLWKATLADYMTSGTAYWIKVRSQDRRRVVQLWWVPCSLMEPRWDTTDPTSFISHYDYTPRGVPIPIREEDVVQFRDGIDPLNTRKGLSPMASLVREIFTDEAASNLTATLLGNLGVPGVIISPKTGTITHLAAEGIKTSYMEKFQGEHNGEPLVSEGSLEITQFGFSPEQMQLRSLRGLPEERITSVLGVNAAVIGLGAGLATTKVGATLREYREEAMESTIIPMYREMASELTHQLLPDFRDTANWRVSFDLSRVRVLQDDEIKRTDRLTSLVTQGVITVAEARRDLDYLVGPEHEVFHIPTGVVVVPDDQRPDAQVEPEAIAAAARTRLVGAPR